jgi:hypothetical protein
LRNEEVSSSNGRASIDPADPVVASGHGAWTITYTAGPDGIAIGGSVRFELPYGFTPPQLLWPQDQGYVSASCSRRDARLQLALEPPIKLDPEPFCYVTRWGRMIYVQVLDRALRSGDTIALQYGHARALSPTAYAPHFAQRLEFTVATDVSGTRAARFSGYALIAEQPALEVVGSFPKSLEIVVPSIVETGVAFPVRVRGVDEYGNLGDPRPGDIDVFTRLDDAEAVPMADAVRGHAFQTELQVPGERELLAVCDDEDVMGSSNPCLCVEEPPRQYLFWGDIHGHTGLSDGLGTPDEYYRFGRDEAFLDFCAIADHAQYLSDEDWDAIQEATARHHDPGRFVTLLGYEFSCNANLEHYGDKCLYYPGDTGPLLRETDINRSRYADMAEFAPLWKAQGAMMVLHQHAKGSCSFYDPDLVRLAEVYSVWGGSESEYCSRPLLPAKDSDYAGHYAADALEQGWVLGLVASSDDHAGRPGATDWLRTQQAYPGGLVAVWAPALTREAVWEALWNRRCYGTTGARIYLEFSVDGEPMGSIIQGSAFSGAHVIEVRAMGDSPIMAAEIIRGRHPIHAYSGYSSSLHFTFRDAPPPGSANYYYVRLTQTNGEMAWSSPVWIV